MVLRLTVRNSHFLRQAFEAIPVDELSVGMVMITWSPTYFAVEAMLTVGYTPVSLLNLAPQSFTSFESTDRQFKAIIDYEQLHAVFRAAQDSDPIEFSQSFECDRIHTHGVLNARFNRPVNTGDSMNDFISMTIIDIRCEDMSPHLSLNTLVPMGIFDKDDFMAAVRTPGTTVFISEGREIELMISSDGESGVISSRSREDGNIIEPIQVRFELKGLDLEGGAALSNKVGVVRRGEEVALIWFRLDETRTRLDGYIIHLLC